MKPKIRQRLRRCTRGFCNVLYPGDDASTDSAFGSVQAAAIFQNAGCTMALHAECTTNKNLMQAQPTVFIGLYGEQNTGTNAATVYSRLPFMYKRS